MTKIGYETSSRNVMNSARLKDRMNCQFHRLADLVIRRMKTHESDHLLVKLIF